MNAEPNGLKTAWPTPCRRRRHCSRRREWHGCRRRERHASRRRERHDCRRRKWHDRRRGDRHCSRGGDRHDRRRCRRRDRGRLRDGWRCRRMLKHVTTSDAQVIGVRRCQVLKVPSNLQVLRRAERRVNHRRCYPGSEERPQFSVLTSSRNSNPISESAEPPPTLSS